MKNKTKKTIYIIILTALFSALCYVATSISIPLGLSKVHLGNFMCILAGLLCGPLVGGFSGAIGLGLNDLTHSYGPDTIIRTIIVKFILGCLSGLLLRYFLKKNNNKQYRIIFASLFGIFLVTFVSFLSLYIIKGKSFSIGSYTFKNSIFLIVCLSIVDLIFLTSFILTFYIKKEYHVILLVTSLVCSINILLEFILKIPFKMLMLQFTFEKAFTYALQSLPSALITTIATIVLVTLIFYPLYLATRKVNKFNDLDEYLNFGHDEPKN